MLDSPIYPGLELPLGIFDTTMNKSKKQTQQTTESRVASQKELEDALQVCLPVWLFSEPGPCLQCDAIIEEFKERPGYDSTIFEPERISRLRELYNALKACKSIFRRGKVAQCLPCIVDLNPADKQEDRSSLANRLKYIWKQLSAELVKLNHATGRNELIASILSIYKFWAVLKNERIEEKCRRLKVWAKYLDRVRMPVSPELNGEDNVACKAYYSWQVYSICHYLRLCLMSQKNVSETVVLNATHEAFDGNWWKANCKIGLPPCSTIPTAAFMIYTFNAMPENANKAFYQNTLKTILNIDSPDLVEQMQQLGLTHFYYRSQELQILQGTDESIDDAGYNQNQGYFFIPASHILQLTPEGERIIAKANAHRLYPTVIYEPGNKNIKRIHAKIRNKLKQMNIDRYYWHLPDERNDGQTGVVMTSQGGMAYTESTRILDSLVTLSEKHEDHSHADTIQNISAESNRQTEIQKRIEAIKQGESFYTKSHGGWKTAMFKAAIINFVGYEPLSMDTPQDYQMMLEASFADMGDFLAKEFQGEALNLPEHFIRPTKTLRGNRVSDQMVQDAFCPDNRSFSIQQLRHLYGFISVTYQVLSERWTRH